jgi:hypothetical protein
MRGEATVTMEPAGSSPDGAITDHLDLPRMRRERHARLQAQMARQGVSAPLHSAGCAVQYAAGSDQPHLFTPHPQGAPSELADDHVHPPLYTASEEGAHAAIDIHFELAGARPDRVAVDDRSASKYMAAAADSTEPS